MTATISEEIKTSLSLKSSTPYWIGVDVGGTNTRVSLLFSGSKSINDYIVISKFRCSDSSVLKDCLNHLSALLMDIFEGPARSACLAAAGPIFEHSKVEITNYTGEKDLDIADLNDFMFPRESSMFINDLEGTCAGIQALNQAGKLHKYFEKLWGPEINTIKLDAGHNLVLAMGTGLGTAALISSFSSTDHTILPMEAGHIYATRLGAENPLASQENELFAYISNKLYNGEHAIEFEDICSGRGLRYVYEFLSKETENIPSAEEIAISALNREEPALESMKIHYRMLLRNAQNLCVALQIKRVFLAGGNQVHNKEVVDMMKSELKEEFLNHIKGSWLEPIGVHTQVCEENFNILGALYTAEIIDLTE